MQSWKGTSIQKIVDDKDWQKLRESFLGTWKKTPKENVKKLREYLKSGSGSEELRYVRVYNYVTGTVFRSGIIKSVEVTKLKKEVVGKLDGFKNLKENDDLDQMIKDKIKRI